MPLVAAMTMTCSPLSSDPFFPSSGIDFDAFDNDCNLSPSPLTSSPYSSSDDDSDDDDEDEYNLRVAPHWQAYRHLFESYGYHLDTCKDVRQFYLCHWETRNIQQSIQSCAGYRSACREDRDDNDLCKDEGLVSVSYSLSDWGICIPLSLAFWPVILALRSVVHASSQSRRRQTDLSSISGMHLTPSSLLPFSVAGTPVPWQTPVR